MSRISYVNGQYLPHALAAIHIDERGMHFSDGVYEVIYLLDNHFVDLEAHLNRLEWSLDQLQISWPVSRQALPLILEEVCRRNKIKRGAVYLQVTRGSAPRAHAFPKEVVPSLIVSVKSAPFTLDDAVLSGAKVVLLPDARWKRPDIKSICLLPNALAKQKAVEEDAYEAVMHLEGLITEGSHSNVWIVNDQGQLMTPPSNGRILNGITRQALIKMAQNLSMPVIEADITVDELLKATEVFLSGTTTFVKPVVYVDDHKIGNATPGPITLKMAALYKAHCLGGNYIRSGEGVKRAS